MHREWCHIGVSLAVASEHLADVLWPKDAIAESMWLTCKRSVWLGERGRLHVHVGGHLAFSYGLALVVAPRQRETECLFKRRAQLDRAAGGITDSWRESRGCAPRWAERGSHVEFS